MLFPWLARFLMLSGRQLKYQILWGRILSIKPHGIVYNCNKMLLDPCRQQKEIFSYMKYIVSSCAFVVAIMTTLSVFFAPLAGNNLHAQESEVMNKKFANTPKALLKEDRVILAGGCFWGMQEIIRKIPGVIKTRVGYSGGTTPNPNYEIISSGRSGHAESVEVTFDPGKLSFAELLGYFFRLHDPTTINRQGNDRGTQYRSAIFYTSEEQKRVAQEVKENVSASGKWKDPVVTEITAAGAFTEAEGYHQDYLQKNPGGYTCHYLRD